MLKQAYRNTVPVKFCFELRYADLFEVKNTGCQGGICLCMLEYLHKVLGIACPSGSNHRYGQRTGHCGGNAEVETGFGTIGVL